MYPSGALGVGGGGGGTSDSTVNYNRNVRKELLQPKQLGRGRAINKYKPAGAFVGHGENQGVSLCPENEEAYRNYGI